MPKRIVGSPKIKRSLITKFDRRFLNIEPRIIVGVFGTDTPKNLSMEEQCKWYLKKLNVKPILKNQIKKAIVYKGITFSQN